MSFMKYHAILDNGIRCQSCCNRCQLFGRRDLDSGWFGDCSECNIRWYRGQLSCVSRETKQMASGKNLWNFGVLATERIFRFAGLDVKFKRLGVIFKRKLMMLKSTLTNVVDSDDEFFDGQEQALQIHPLTLLDDMAVNSPILEREILDGLPAYRLSLLDIVATFLVELKHFSSDYHILRLSSQDYVFEPYWIKYVWEGREWLGNYRTGEFFYVDAPGPWIAYSYRHAVWWLNEKRWFWE